MIDDGPGCRLPRSCRLTDASQYRHVFARPARAGNSGFTLLYRPNAVGHARLGLAVSRKYARRAVERNRIKRLVRESFRCRFTLPDVDIVVLCTRTTRNLSNPDLFALLHRAWTVIERSATETSACVDSSSSPSGPTNT